MPNSNRDQAYIDLHNSLKVGQKVAILHKNDYGIYYPLRFLRIVEIEPLKNGRVSDYVLLENGTKVLSRLLVRLR